MRKLSYTLITFILLLPSLLRAQEMPSWQEGWMDIHHIATGKGENSLFVFPDGTTMLVDLGDETNGRFKCPAYPDASRTPGQWVVRYINHFAAGTPGKGEKVDYLELTHFHSDHMGSPKALREGPRYGLCGITDAGESLRFGKIVDRAYPDYDKVAANKPVTKEYAKFVAYHRDSLGALAERFEIGSRSQFALRHNPKPYKKNFEILNVASNGYLTTGKGSKTWSMFRLEDRSKYDENMLSNAFVVTYGPFRYFNGGDLGGGVASGEDNWWRDFESQVADFVGPVTAMKSNHHAWKEAMNPYLLSVMQPEIVVSFCSHINHPWKTSVQRMADHLYPNPISHYTTTDSGREQVGSELFDAAIKACGHIVIRVYEGGTSYQVFVLDARSTDYKVIYTSPVIDLGRENAKNCPRCTQKQKK